MGDVPSSPSSESPPSSSPPSLKNNLPMLYYGLVVVGIAAILLAIYNLLVIRWCRHRERQRPPPYASGSIETEPRSTSQSFQLSRRNLLESSSFKYKKDIINNNNVNNDNMGSGDYDHECSVCLSEFEDGEEVRQLPRCNHSFHAPCIDMWLDSHHDCPLCRAIVHIPTPPPPPSRHSLTVGSSSPENSREGFV